MCAAMIKKLFSTLPFLFVFIFNPLCGYSAVMSFNLDISCSAPIDNGAILEVTYPIINQYTGAIVQSAPQQAYWYANCTYIKLKTCDGVPAGTSSFTQKAPMGGGFGTGGTGDIRLCCPAGQTSINGVCTACIGTVSFEGDCEPPECPGGQQLINGVCECPTFTQWNGEECVPCPSGHWDVLSGQCINLCPHGDYGDNAPGEIVGSPSGYGVCVTPPCGPGEYADPVTGACKNNCSDPLNFNVVDGSCLPPCGSGMSRSAGQDCTCNEGFTPDGQSETCSEPCPPGTEKMNDGSCFDPDVICPKCQHEEMYEGTKICVDDVPPATCPEGQYVPPGDCICVPDKVDHCPPGYHVASNGECEINDDPTNPDDDGDGIPDLEEPNDPDNDNDDDNDGLADTQDNDDDNDGVEDGQDLDDDNDGILDGDDQGSDQGQGYGNGYGEERSDDYFYLRWRETYINLKQTDLFQLVDFDFSGGGSSTYGVNIPDSLGGDLTFDFSDYPTVWTVLRGVFLVGFGWLSIRIILLKG